MSPPSSTLAPRSTTIGRPVEVRGVGLFTGKPVVVMLRPGEAGAGIGFRRVDLGSPESGARIAAMPDFIQPEARRTVLGTGPTGPSVQTVEHLLSAVRGMGLTDLEVEVSGPELPIGDGSAGLWVSAIRGAGVVERQAPAAAAVVVREPVRFGADGAVVEALPLSPSELGAAADGRGPAAFYSYHLDLSNFPIAALAPIACKRIPAQLASVELMLNGEGGGDYEGEVAPARTFSLLEEAQAARAAGLFRHVSPRDLLVIGNDGPIDNAYRFDNEPARHKLLDLIGDLALCGRPIVGRFVATRSGHALNQRLATRLAELA